MSPVLIIALVVVGLDRDHVSVRAQPRAGAGQTARPRDPEATVEVAAGPPPDPVAPRRRVPRARVHRNTPQLPGDLAHDRPGDGRLGLDGRDRRSAQPDGGRRGRRDHVPRRAPARFPRGSRDVRRRGGPRGAPHAGTGRDRGRARGDRDLTRHRDRGRPHGRARRDRGDPRPVRRTLPAAVLLLSDGRDTGSRGAPERRRRPRGGTGRAGVHRVGRTGRRGARGRRRRPRGHAGDLRGERRAARSRRRPPTS